MNKYEKWYTTIIKGSKDRILDRYTEWHHIVPRSLGGTDDPDNLVKLTAREHFVCHWLLTKIYPTGEDHWRMINAFRMMRANNPKQQRYQTAITSRVYENLKQEYSKLQSQRVSGENNPMYGDKFRRGAAGNLAQKEAISGDKNGAKSSDARKKISESKLGRRRAPFSAEWKQKLSDASKGENNSRYGAKVSVETRKKIGDRLRGRCQSEEEKLRRAAANKGKVREKKTCPHCQQHIAVNTYPRWHGDRCRQRLNIT